MCNLSQYTPEYLDALDFEQLRVLNEQLGIDRAAIRATQLEIKARMDKNRAEATAIDKWAAFSEVEREAILKAINKPAPHNIHVTSIASDGRVPVPGANS